MDQTVKKGLKYGIPAVVVFLLIAAVPLWCIPQYSIYKREMRGKSLLKEAEWTRRITVEEAKAQLESAKMIRLADVERAKGVADSVEVIGDSLLDNPNYLKYLWISNIDTTGERIYIPTGKDGFPELLEVGASQRALPTAVK